MLPTYTSSCMCIKSLSPPSRAFIALLKNIGEGPVFHATLGSESNLSNYLRYLGTQWRYRGTSDMSLRRV